MSERVPGHRFPLCEYLQEEMQARGWADDDIYARIDGPVDQCAAYLAIYGEEKGLILDAHTASVLSRLFDVSTEFLTNLNRSAQEPQA